MAKRRHLVLAEDCPPVIPAVERTRGSTGTRCRSVLGDSCFECGAIHELKNQLRVLESVTKWRKCVTDTADIPVAVHEAFQEMYRDGCKPVALSIPYDVLDSDAYPSIAIESVALSGPRWNPTVRAQVTLRGATRALRFPAAVAQVGGLLTVIADFQLRQSDFGITPYTALGGGLQVRDRIDVRVHLLARRAG